MKSITIPLLVVGLLIPVTVSSADVEIALEAELADVLDEPLLIAEDENASDGKFLWTEGEPAAGGPNDGKGGAEYIINIPEPGKYALWAHVIAWDGNSDSFWVTWLPADPDENGQLTGNTQYRWSVAAGAAWHWDRINHWLDGGTFDREWEFDAAGETVLKIRTREDATMIDAIFVTSNVKAADQAGANVRLPTDDDRELQVEGLAVNPADKISTSWGAIKRQYRR